MRDANQLVELSACGPDDPDARHAGVILAAYFQAQHTQVFRRLLWRRLAAVAAVACVIAATTPLLPETGLFVALLAVAAAAAAAAVMEWRAKETLRALLDGRGVESGPA